MADVWAELAGRERRNRRVCDRDSDKQASALEQSRRVAETVELLVQPGVVDS